MRTAKEYVNRVATIERESAALAAEYDKMEPPRLMRGEYEAIAEVSKEGGVRLFSQNLDESAAIQLRDWLIAMFPIEEKAQ